MIRFEDVVEKVRAYSPDADLELLRRAYVFSAFEHKGQVRHSGEPYMVHPLEVADFLANLRLDVVAIAASPETPRPRAAFPRLGFYAERGAMSAFRLRTASSASGLTLSHPRRYIPSARGPGGRGLRKQGEESPGSTERRCRLMAGGGDPRESATESNPPGFGPARSKGWGKSPPRLR